MSSIRVRTRAVLLGIGMAVALPFAAAACGGDGYATSRGASGATRTPPPSRSPTPATPGGTKVIVKAQNSTYDNTALTAPAGTVTIEFDNTDAGVTHNLQLHHLGDDEGTVGETPITEGPDKQSFTVRLEPGPYHFHCEVHPTTMTGTLTVS